MLGVGSGMLPSRYADAHWEARVYGVGGCRVFGIEVWVSKREGGVGVEGKSVVFSSLDGGGSELRYALVGERRLGRITGVSKASEESELLSWSDDCIGRLGYSTLGLLVVNGAFRPPRCGLARDFESSDNCCKIFVGGL